MDQVSIFKPVTKWAERVTDTRRIPELISKAVRMATQGQQGPVYLDLPGDILYTQVELDDVHFPRNLPKQPRPSRDAELIEEAVALLKQAKRPLILTGSGILWSDASAALQTFVDLTGIPFYTTPQGRGVIPEDHPLSFLGARSKAFKEADVVLVVGTRLNFIVGFGLPPRWAEDVKIIQSDVHREELGRNRTIDVGIVGDARRVLEQLTAAASTAFPQPIDLPWIDALRSPHARMKKKPRPCCTPMPCLFIPCVCARKCVISWTATPSWWSTGMKFSTTRVSPSPPTRQATASMPALMAAWAWRS